MTQFIDIQHKFVATLMRIPGMDDYSFRSSLLQGLPPTTLQRSAGVAMLDLNNIISGLNGLGRLADQGGTRPLIVVVDNALAYVPAGGDVARELNEVKRLLAEHYGGDAQAPIAATSQDLKELEALVFGRYRDTRLAFAFITAAERTARSVMRLTVPRIFDGVQQAGVGYGTGWLIARGVVITNHHVIDNRDIQMGESHASPEDFKAQAEATEAWLDYYQEIGGNPLKCAGAHLLASSLALDYAVIELVEAAKVADRAPLPTVGQQSALVRGSRMNIVQHARGGPLQYAIRNNFFVRPGDTPQFIRYQTDTEPGASGSPVCDDTWHVVGLHHASTTVPVGQLSQTVPQEVIDGKPVTVTLLNEAIAIHAILNDLPTDVKQRILAS